MKRIFVIGLVLTGLLFSCNKDENKEDSVLKDGQEVSDKERCLELVFPITFIMPDESTITGDSREEVGAAIKAWHEANPDVQGKARIQYPVEAKFKNKPVTINNQKQMERLKKACEDGKRPCFTMIYPVTYTMPDGSEITGENRKDIRIAIKAWYEANPGVEERPVLQFPVDIKMKGEIITVNNAAELQEIKKSCDHKDPCFHFIYPITYIMPDATSITVLSEDDREHKMEIRAWYQEHPDVAEKPVLEFPVKVKMVEDGSIKTINTQDEMIELREYCKENAKP